MQFFPNVKFYKSFLNVNQIQECKIPPIPAVAIVGRSNSGKSSLINALCNQKKLALTSATPGKTRTINYFYVPSNKPHYKEFFLVDLPGYGFAQLSKAENEQLHYIIDQYIANAPFLKMILLIMDSRRKLEKEEYSILNYCLDHDKDILLIRSKWDKLKQTERDQLLKEWKNEPILFERTIPVSSLKKIHIDVLVKRIIESINQ
jgi:GTP-binding protein